MSTSISPVETISDHERHFLGRFVTNTDGPVFCLVNLPEVVKGALFARYSRSRLPLRRLMLDEFRSDLESAAAINTSDHQLHSEALYKRIFSEYGDDSVAQLGSVHVACEGFSNIAIKVLERGRLMSYLEQSTRYIPYTDRPGGRWKYHVPAELQGGVRRQYVEALDRLFATYADFIPAIQTHLLSKVSAVDAADPAIRRAIRARSLDVARGLLPAATRSNVGIHGSGHAFEQLLVRLRASDNQEVQYAGSLLLTELRKVMPAFVSRVDRPERGVAWSQYLKDTRREFETVARRVAIDLRQGSPIEDARVELLEFDPEAEKKVLAAALYVASDSSEAAILRTIDDMTEEQRSNLLRLYVGDRMNRRQKPGRALERSSYTFDIVGDYGSFRDLQRHRMMSIEWQPLGMNLGFDLPELVSEAGLESSWREAMAVAGSVYDRILTYCGPDISCYAVPLAFRVRYYMHLNARELMHIAELRSSPQGHENYRDIVLRMVDLIRSQARHGVLADAMSFVDRRSPLLGRCEAEKRGDPR